MESALSPPSRAAAGGGSTQHHHPLPRQREDDPEQPWDRVLLVGGDLEEEVMVRDRLVAWRRRCDQLRLQNRRW